jgi:hypothetical protein
MLTKGFLSDDEKRSIREQLFAMMKIVGIPEQLTLWTEPPPHDHRCLRAPLDVAEFIDMQPYREDGDDLIWAMRYIDSNGRKNTIFFKRV